MFNGFETVSANVSLSSPHSPADLTLSLRPFSPADVNQFTPGVYSEASGMVPASGDTLTEDTARVALESLLSKRITNADSVVDERYKSEAFALFGPLFARVALQSDTQTGEAGKITGSAILALLAMEQALVDSTIAQSGTELSRRLNTQMFGRLNSGKAGFPGIGIYQTPEGEAFPGGRTFTSYAAVFEPLDDVETPATRRGS